MIARQKSPLVATKSNGIPLNQTWTKVELDFETVAQDGDSRFDVYLELHGAAGPGVDSCVLIDDFRVWKTN